MNLRWPRSPFLRIAGPAPGVLDPRTYVESAFGERSAVEEMGLQLRVMLDAADSFQAGDRLAYDKDGRAQADIEGRRIAAIAIASDGSRVMANLSGILATTVEAPGPEDVGQDQVVTAGRGVVPSAETFHQIDSVKAPLAVDTATRTAVNRAGMAISESAVLFDGTAPLVPSRSLSSDDFFVDVAAAGGATYAEFWHPSDMRSVFEVKFSAPGESVDVYYPIHLPTDFQIFNRGLAPAIAFDFRASAGGSVRARLDPRTFQASGSTGGAWSTYEVLFDAVNGIGLSLGWMVVTLTGGVGSIVAVERAASFRYQSNGDFQ